VIIAPLQPGQVYVVVRAMAEWERYPVPPDLVRKSTILSVFRSENTSEYALAYYNFSQSLALVPLKDIYIFDWTQASNQRNSGLAPAYTTSSA
jgi:hypothetical protein